jgi:hypothetical protein
MVVVSACGFACSSPKPDDSRPAATEGGSEGSSATGGDDASTDSTMASDGSTTPDSPDEAGPDADAGSGDAEHVDAAPADAAPDVDAAPADAGPDVLPGPSAIDPGHLRLWLTADRGMGCTAVPSTDGGVGRRVTYWADQSGHSDDAFLMLGELGPRCEVDGGAHAANGVQLPYFSAPQTGNVIDETLDVDLSFLTSPAYTVFAVERRWADYSLNSPQYQESILGTSEPPAVEAQNPQTCATVTPDQIFSLAYRYGDSALDLEFDQWCGVNIIYSGVSAVPSSPPAPLALDMVRLDPTSGHELWVDGDKVGTNTMTDPIVYASGGAIGRAFIVTTVSGQDMRFRGDIAEILAYDTALSDVDRVKVEAYLRGHWGLP